MNLNVLLISTYEMGRQPFGLASPAAWLREAGAHVECVDLAVDAFPEDRVRDANLIAFYVPMHTATRLAVDALLCSADDVLMVGDDPVADAGAARCGMRTLLLPQTPPASDNGIAAVLALASA